MIKHPQQIENSSAQIKGAGQANLPLKMHYIENSI